MHEAQSVDNADPFKHRSLKRTLARCMVEGFMNGDNEMYAKQIADWSAMDRIRRIDSRGLPVFKIETIEDKLEFLEDPERFRSLFPDAESPAWILASLAFPKHSDKKPPRIHDLEWDEVVDLITNDGDDYYEKFILGFEPRDVFAGTLILDKYCQLKYTEMLKGKLSDLTHGRAAPMFISCSGGDNIQESTQYDERFANCMENAAALCQEHSAHGYFEFIYYFDKTEQKLKPVFYEYLDNLLYTFEDPKTPSIKTIMESEHTYRYPLTEYDDADKAALSVGHML